MQPVRKKIFFINSSFRKVVCNTIFVRFSSYKNSLLLPKTNFPHKVKETSRRERDCLIENTAKFEDLYDWQKSQNRDHEYILHDGPPYANGDVHIGHGVNKILKDITVRFKLLQGFKIHFVPGWDCHGLPIELKVLKNNILEKDKSNLNIRKKAHEFSQKTKEKQLKSFKNWGILADWKNSYITCNPDYIIQQLNIFQDLYDQGIIFQDYKPVFWSPCNKTSLAEAELEYNPNHISPSIYLKLKIHKCPDFFKSKHKTDTSLNLIIWTTTPWTLPANQAVCYSDHKRYSIVQNSTNKENYIVAEELISSLANTLKTELILIQSFQGFVLKDVTYFHPIIKERVCSLYSSLHVTMSKGTGLVHTAPNHGLDDYNVFMKQNLPLDPCMVDDNGQFTKEAGIELYGKDVLSEGSKHIINMLKDEILCIEEYIHSYPYDWRSKTPIIVKSSHQWFIDVQSFQNQAMECLESVKFFPDHFRKVFLSQLKSSPQWCISRQRSWGVPIPAFYTEINNKPIVNRILTDHLCCLIKNHGIHCWWELDIKDLLPSSLIKKCELKEDNYKKGLDIMDIWLDSGVSWKNVLPEPHISDVCIEGIDQLRGWFNSSLLTSFALRKKAPYKSLVFHGFTTDSEGRKMSKSEGNVISPDDILSGSKKNKTLAYGIDVLRFWVASHACQHENIAVKYNIIEECSQNINKFRNVFKFLLGSLNDFCPSEDIISPLKMRPLDLYMLHALENFMRKVIEEYAVFQYKNVSKEIVNFTTNDISSFYCHLVKDRLYCDLRNSCERLSCQTVLYFVLNTLLQSIGPVCPHLAEEVVMHHPDENAAKRGLFKTNWPDLAKFLNTNFPSHVDLANQIRQSIVKTDIKTLDKDAVIVASHNIIESIKLLNMNVPDDSGYTEFFQVASLTFDNDVKILPEKTEVITGHIQCSKEKFESYTVILKETNLEKCPRCRRYAIIGSSTLCKRCLYAVNFNSSEMKYKTSE